MFDDFITLRSTSIEFQWSIYSGISFHLYGKIKQNEKLRKVDIVVKPLFFHFLQWKFCHKDCGPLDIIEETILIHYKHFIDNYLLVNNTFNKLTCFGFNSNGSSFHWFVC